VNEARLESKLSNSWKKSVSKQRIVARFGNYGSVYAHCQKSTTSSVFIYPFSEFRKRVLCMICVSPQIFSINSFLLLFVFFCLLSNGQCRMLRKKLLIFLGCRIPSGPYFFRLKWARVNVTLVFSFFFTMVLRKGIIEPNSLKSSWNLKRRFQLGITELWRTSKHTYLRILFVGPEEQYLFISFRYTLIEAVLTTDFSNITCFNYSVIGCGQVTDYIINIVIV